MNTAAEALPDDVAALRALLLEAWAERDAERAEKARLAGQNDRLRHLIRQLQRMQFGKRSEKLDPDQLNLGLEDLEQALAAEEADQEKADPALRRSRAEKRRAGRSSLPDHLPRIEVVIEPDDTACPCFSIRPPEVNWSIWFWAIPSPDIEVTPRARASLRDRHYGPPNMGLGG
jgi:transposase